MKKLIGAFVMLIFLFLLQTGIINKIAIAGVKPNVIIIIVVALGYRYGKIPGMLTGFFAGLLLDFTEGDYLGYFALMYLLIGYLVGFCNKIYNNDLNVVPLVLIAASDFVLGFMQYIFGFLLRNRLDLPYYLIRIILPEMIYTVVISAFLYKLIDMTFVFLEKKKEKVEKEEEET